MTKTQYTDHFLPTAEGPMIHYRIYAPKGATSGLPILCLHGLTRNLKDFDDIAPKLAAMGRTIVSASMRGRGRSDPETDPDRYSPAIYTGDMLGLLDHLDIEKVLIIGTSMGGLMAMIAASAAPERVAGVVLNDIGPELDPAGIARIQSYVGKSGPVENWQQAATTIQQINGPAFPQKTEPGFWMDFAKKTFREDKDGQIVLDYDPQISRSVASGNEDLMDLWPLFAALADIPTLLLRGGISDLLSRQTVAKMSKAKPDMLVVEVPGVGHAPTLEEPQSWNAIKEFILGSRFIQMTHSARVDF